MSDIEHTLDQLRLFIKKEIIENYFAERSYLEEDRELLQEKIAAYRQETSRAARRFAAFYQAIGSEAAINAVCRLLALKERPFYDEFQQMSPTDQQALLKNYHPRGLTARRRYKHLVFEVYERLWQTAQLLWDRYAKIATHCKLYNEDVQNFNANYDFNLIASQIEALEGESPVLESGLSARDREELGARMALRRYNLEAEHLPRLPALPPLQEIKSRLSQVLDEFYRP